MAIHRQVGLPWDEDPLGKAAYNPSTSVALTDCPSLQFPSACSRDVIITPVTESGGRNDSQLMLLNHQSPMPGSNFSQSRSPTSGPSLQSPFLPTNLSTRSCDVPVMEPSGRNDPELTLLSHWFPMPSDIYLSSPNTTSAQSPDGLIDDHCGGHNLSLHDEIHDTDDIPQQHTVYTSPYQHNADMSSQNHPTFSKLEMLKNGREFLGLESKSKF
jgi:hypothetical protein